MCGIGALLSRRGTSDVAALVGPFMDVVRHRGPDGEGTALLIPGEGIRSFARTDTPVSLRRTMRMLPASSNARVALGHRRLAIVDVTDTGHQPMVSPCERYAVSFNGEIYNHGEIRRQLQAAGRRFESTSDTEVLLAAYIEWGSAALHRFNGMFSFVVIDTVRRVLFAARDRFGVKPLYYWVSDDAGLVALASEIKQFTTLPAFGARMNRDRALDFLAWGLTDHTDETLFEGVRQVPGGHAITLSLEEASDEPPTPRPWYRLTAGPTTHSFEEARRWVRDLWLDAVRLRLRADVPVGVALSGGVDSSSIACAASEVLARDGAPHRLQTFSAGSHVERFDERKHIVPIVEAIGAVPHYALPTVDGLFAALDAMTWHHDEPFSGTSVFAEWEVFRLVASTPVKVTLDGHGADELFGGYPEFVGAVLMDLASHGQFGRLRHEWRALRERHSVRRLTASVLHLVLPDAILEKARVWSGAAPIAPTWFGTKGPRSRHTQSPRARHYRESLSFAGLSRAELLATSLPMQLRWADRDSMAHSIESRTPCLDYRLVEYVYGCPTEFKMRDGVTKALLRAAMDGIVPARTLARRDKMGFMTAEEHWARVEARERFVRELEAAREVALDVIGPEGWSRAQSVLETDVPFHLLFWRFISFGRWMRRFGVST